ncbi:LysR substrate-binding domain-containing protein [Paraburkholderia gardini]|uniref:LysR substrate-binding domain-containing protein n=1 Tax=Paraburkholderia gardini TaxID=2823469 RepID=UPI001DAC2DAC|nr:LysR substrate-binding domain-containing protein [Paraburkholderia gardini]CAG4899554.1 Hca operon transcriptional activator HcaR [Paraburkholderia gardini]
MIDLRQLRYFVTLAEELNFGRAATRLHITQPPLSQQIMQLEAELDTPLFIRGKRPLRLTQAGVELLAGARRLLAQSEVVIEHAKLAGRGERGRLGIAFISGSLPKVLPECIGAFRQRHPDVRLDLREGVSSTQRETILAGEMDVGFVRPVGNDTDELTSRMLLSEPMMLAVPDQHALALVERVPVGALAAEPLILFNRQHSRYFHRIVSDILQRAGVTPEVAQDATQLYTVVALVSSRLGVAIVPASARHMRFPGVVFRHLELDRPVSAVLELTWRTGDTNPALLNFIDIAVAEADRYSHSSAL